VAGSRDERTRDDPSAPDRRGKPRPGGISIDDEGHFLVHGEPVTHARTLEVLWSSLARRADGTWQVSVGRESADVAIAATPWVVRGVLPSASGLSLFLSDGSSEPLDPATIRVGKDGVLRCTLRSGHPARFGRAAQIALGERLEEDGSAPSGFRLEISGRAWPLGSE